MLYLSVELKGNSATNRMKNKAYTTKKKYEIIMQQLDVLAHANPGSKEAEELKVLTRDFVQYLKKSTHRA